MKTSEAGIALIKGFERLELEPYHDPVGYPTIGWGHLLTRERWADLSQWLPISKEQAHVYLRNDLAVGENAVELYTEAPLSQGQHAALVSFVFNLGAGALQNSTLLTLLNRGKYPEVPAQLRRWVFAKGIRLNGLVKRREAEIALGTPWKAPA